MCIVDQCEYAVCGHTVSTTQHCRVFTKGEKTGTYKKAENCPKYKVIKRTELYKCMAMLCAKPTKPETKKEETKNVETKKAGPVAKSINWAEVVENDKKEAAAKKAEQIKKPELFNMPNTTAAEKFNTEQGGPGGPNEVKNAEKTRTWAKIVEEEKAAEKVGRSQVALVEEESLIVSFLWHSLFTTLTFYRTLPSQRTTGRHFRARNP